MVGIKEFMSSRMLLSPSPAAPPQDQCHPNPDDRLMAILVKSVEGVFAVT
jgi:hypothetical protein